MRIGQGQVGVEHLETEYVQGRRAHANEADSSPRQKALEHAVVKTSLPTTLRILQLTAS